MLLSALKIIGLQKIKTMVSIDVYTSFVADLHDTTYFIHLDFIGTFGLCYIGH